MTAPRSGVIQYTGRAFEQDADQAMGGDIVKALVELITNADDAYGPNTGGMGAYSPAPVVDAAMTARIMDTIIAPTLAGMRADGRPYQGFLYAGVMIDAQGTPRVLE